MNRRSPRLHPAVVLAALCLAAVTTGCTSYRILRYRQPDARNQSMFPSRAVRAADAPFQFARAARPRADLDTVTVRAPDGRRIPFADYLREYRVLSFLVIRNDTILYETYREGLTDTTIHSSFSVAKSVLSALVGIAVDEGAIRSLDDSITHYIAELRGRPAFDGITVRHLLGMSSGLRYKETGGGPLSDFRSDEARLYYSTHMLKWLSRSARVNEPGEMWDYKDTDAELLGWVLSRATGMTVSAYTEEKLWRPIGTERGATWSLDHSGGQEKVSTAFNATARDFARFGRLYLHNGTVAGQQIIPADWVRRSIAVDSTREEPEVTTWWKMQHTMYWWHPIHPPVGDFYADGSRGQRVYVDPRTNTIIVQLANLSNQDFPFRKVVAYLNGDAWEYPRPIPALVRQAAVTHGADSVRPVFARLDAARREAPQSLTISRAAMLTIGTLVANDATTRAAGIEILRLNTELYPEFADAFARLAAACRSAGDRACAAAAARRVEELRRR